MTGNQVENFRFLRRSHLAAVFRGFNHQYRRDFARILNLVNWIEIALAFPSGAARKCLGIVRELFAFLKDVLSRFHGPQDAVKKEYDSAD